MSDDVMTYFPALRAYSLALCRNGPDAEDLVQETLLRAIEKAHQYQRGTNMRAWLFSIMRSRFLNNCAKGARERTGAKDCASLIPRSKPSQEWHLMAGEMARALNDMPAHYREAIVLVGALGVSYIEAAELLACDIGTIKSRVNRARSLLRQQLQPDD
ncbi:sigma-70 family RNA polymerase sigma factor [Paracoccus sp. p4-l81]|uniref:sigma-70 family RNA polymerase sigma factor n=1 Tax=Paracoccus sp. p4-l81 TaxID=3342806 RepID=UPI0035BAC3AE